jgi:hypothetical protein
VCPLWSARVGFKHLKCRRKADESLPDERKAASRKRFLVTGLSGSSNIPDMMAGPIVLKTMSALGIPDLAAERRQCCQFC